MFSTLTRAIAEGIGVGFMPLSYVTRELSESHIEIYGPRLWEHKVFLFAKARHAQDQFTLQLSRHLAAVGVQPRRMALQPT